MTSLADDYTRQARWRSWDLALSRLPLRPGQRVVDVGCGVGIDDLLGHEPMPGSVRQALLEFYRQARYDFECGRRLAAAARGAGLAVVHEESLPDRELAFDGPASDDVLAAWQRRLARMLGLRAFASAAATEIERSILAALSAPDHRSLCRVVYVIAERR